MRIQFSWKTNYFCRVILIIMLLRVKKEYVIYECDDDECVGIWPCADYTKNLNYILSKKTYFCVHPLRYIMRMCILFFLQGFPSHEYKNNIMVNLSL